MEELVKRLKQLQVQLDGLEQAMGKAMERQRKHLMSRSSNRLDQCEWKLKKMEKYADGILMQPSLKSKLSSRVMKMPLGL